MALYKFRIIIYYYYYKYTANMQAQFT